jgi:hypothetical protein
MMIDYRQYPYFDKVEYLRVLADELKDVDWRVLRDKLSREPKDCKDTSIWWYSRTSKDNKVFHNSNSQVLLEDTEYPEGSGHFNIQITEHSVPELSSIKDCILSLPGIQYAGAFFIGPNSLVEEHTDAGTFNILINIKVPIGAFLTVQGSDIQFTNGQIFMFDGELVHSATNKTNDDWVVLALRIKKDLFNI